MNSLNNLPPFYIGQKVVYITGIHMPKGSIHTVSDYHEAPCGCKSIAINGHKITRKTGEFNCTDHPGEFIGTYDNDDNTYYPESFRPLVEQTLPLISYSKVLEEVLVGTN